MDAGAARQAGASFELPGALEWIRQPENSDAAGVQLLEDSLRAVSFERTPALGGALWIAHGGGGGIVNDAGGRYSIPGLAAGTYTVRAQPSSLVPGERPDVQVPLADTARGIDLVLETGETLPGRVVHEKS